MKRKLRRLLLSITSRCNLRCKYCYVFNGNTEAPVLQTMEPQTMKKLIRETFQNYDSVDFVQFFGGEPNLALPAMNIAVEEIKKNREKSGMPLPEFGIITNLTFLNNKILDFYRDIHLKVTVSLDGPETIHDALRKYESGAGGAHSKVIANLKRLRQNKIPFSAEVTFTKAHTDKGVTITELLKYFETTGAERVDIVCVMANPGSDLDVYSGDFSRLVGLFTEAVDYWFDYWRKGGQMKFGIVHEIIGAIVSKGQVYCPAGESYLAIAPDGSFYPCHLFIGNKKYKLGNAGSSKLVSDLKNSLKNSELCKKCDIKSLCFSCLGRNEFYCKTWEKPFEYDCILKREVVARVLKNLETEISCEAKN